MEDEKKCVVALFLDGTILTAGQMRKVTATSWAIGFDSRLKYKFVAVTVQADSGTRPVSYTMPVRGSYLY
jgi:hypothetical protein